MVMLANVLNRLHTCKVLVIGDMLLDSYTIGKARRISPEAPVAVVNVQSEEHRPGGAGNVILNLLSLGAHVIGVGRIGNDWAGKTLTNALKNEGVDVSMLVRQDDYRTPIKNRIIADNQQIVRIDHEQSIPLSESLEQSIIDQMEHLLEGVQVVAISDYGKGFLTTTLIGSLISAAHRRQIPVITDPKGHDFKKYQGTTIIKPNLSEAYAAANLPAAVPLNLVASTVLRQCEAKLLMVTRSEAGISLFNDQGSRSDFPVQAKQVKDVTGAGDTVLAMLAVAIANRLSYDEAAQLCNVAAGIAIEHVGCARVSLSDLALRLFEHHMTQKLFDQEHLFILQTILKKQPYNLLFLSEFEMMTYPLYREIKQLSAEGKSLLVFIEDQEANNPSLEILSSLQEVSFMIIHLDCLKKLCQHAIPQQVIAFNGKDGKLENIELQNLLGEKYECECSVSVEVSTRSRSSRS